MKYQSDESGTPGSSREQPMIDACHRWPVESSKDPWSGILERPLVGNPIRNREFRLHPSEETNEIIRYVVAVMMERTGIRLSCISVMSNHWHLCASDPEGRICDFTRDAHSFIARAVNATHGDFEGFWSTEQTSHVTCVEPDDFIAKIAYAMANPVEALLVERGEEWPGVRMAWPAPAQVVKRPEKFFRGVEEGGIWPETAVLEMSRPPGYAELSDEELAVVVNGAIEDREQAIREKARRKGKKFMGVKKLLKQSRYDRPKSEEERFELVPTVACRSKWRRIERLAWNRLWRDAYEAALEKWVAGDRMVEFPYGTYKMRVLHRVVCAPPPT